MLNDNICKFTARTNGFNHCNLIWNGDSSLESEASIKFFPNFCSEFEDHRFCRCLS